MGAKKCGGKGEYRLVETKRFEEKATSFLFIYFPALLVHSLLHCGFTCKKN